MAKIKIGIAGCGSIGTAVAKSVIKNFKMTARLCALYDIDIARAVFLAKQLGKPGLVVKDLTGLIKRVNLVIEAAHANSAEKIAKESIFSGRDCMIMSVGGLLNKETLFALAAKFGRRIFIPSGAICGIDGLSAHKLAKIKQVAITTYKPPSALKNAPYVIKNKINLNAIRRETTIFEGNAQEAIKGFPQNINVSATISLAGIGTKKTKVKIICFPDTGINIHEVEIVSDAGRTFIRCQNNPSPDNPKTSYLAALSAIAALKNILSPVKIGT